MKIVVAPDSFKGSLSASRAAEAIAAGVRRAAPDAELALVPLADGGEGTVEAFVTAAGGRIVPVRVTGPLGEPVEAFLGVLDQPEHKRRENGDCPKRKRVDCPHFRVQATAVVEMAAASGLPLVPEALRNPMSTTSYGTGELIRHALELGCERVILGNWRQRDQRRRRGDGSGAGWEFPGRGRRGGRLRRRRTRPNSVHRPLRPAPGVPTGVSGYERSFAERISRNPAARRGNRRVRRG